METLYYLGQGYSSKGQVLYGEREVRIDRQRQGGRGTEFSSHATMSIGRSNEFPPTARCSSRRTSCVSLVFGCRKVVSNCASIEVGVLISEAV